MNEKDSLGDVSHERQYLGASDELGRILTLPQIDQIVGEFGSRLIRTVGDNTEVFIEPPVSEADLPRLGRAFVDFSQSLEALPPTVLTVNGKNYT